MRGWRRWRRAGGGYRRALANCRHGRCFTAWGPRPSPTTRCSAWRTLATLPQRWTAPVFPLKAADFIARGVEKGPVLGGAMRAAEKAWIAAGFPEDPEELDAIAI